MSRIDELIERLCPDGVPYKHLREIGSVSRGGGFQKKDFTECGFPCIHYGQIYTSLGLHTYATSTFVRSSIFTKSKKAHPGDIIMAVTSENIEDVCSCTTWLGNGDVAVSGHIAVISHNLNPKYLTYFFHSSSFYQWKTKYAHGTKVIEVTPNKLLDVPVPVPPMEIQEEIVRILDSFSELEAELEAELEQRNKQYRYYREKLIDQTTSAPWYTLGEISQISRGASPRPIKKYIAKGNEGIPWIKIGDVDPNGKYVTSTNERITNEGATKSRFLQPGSFILSNSMSFGRPYILKLGGCIHDGWLSIENYEDQFLPDYLYHLLRSNMVQAYWRKRANNGSVSNLNAELVKSTPVPAPSLEEQCRIVSILDKFDALVNDLSSGIPAEIEARRKQYEYYRDKLLTFKEKPGD